MNSPRRTRDRGALVFPLILAITAAAAVACARGASPVGLWVFVFVLGGWLITLCLHEFAHAVVSLAGGDTSVRERGYLTLNLLRYTDPANSFIIPLVLLAIGGIPLPGGAVLVEPGRLRYRWWSSLVSAAGPVTNLLAGIVLTLVATPIDSVLGSAVAFLALIQFVVAILNILPVPGFDGFGVITPYLSNRFLQQIQPYRQWAPLGVFAILWGVPGASGWLFAVASHLFDLAGGNNLQAYDGQSLFLFWRN
ncbi:MAG: site-2 protease family protein [Nakamurella sp.]